MLTPQRSTLFPYTTLFRSRARELVFELGHLAGASLQTTGAAITEKRRIRPTRKVIALGIIGVRDVITDRTIAHWEDRKSSRLNSSHTVISYAVFCLKQKNH